MRIWPKRPPRRAQPGGEPPVDDIDVDGLVTKLRAMSAQLEETAAEFEAIARRRRTEEGDG